MPKFYIYFNLNLILLQHCGNLIEWSYIDAVIIHVTAYMQKKT